MKITYIHHSGVSVETEHAVFWWKWSRLRCSLIILRERSLKSDKISC